MQLQRALHDPSRGVSVCMISSMISHFLKKLYIYIPLNHKCWSFSSYAVRMRDFTHYVIMLERSWVVCSSSVYFVQKGWLRLKTPSHFLLQLQNRTSKAFLCKGHLTFFARSLCKQWVGASIYCTSRVTFPMWLSRASARGEFVVKKYIHLAFFFNSQSFC